MCKKLAVLGLMGIIAFVAIRQFDIKFGKKKGTLEDRITELREKVARLDKEEQKNIHLLAVEERKVDKLKESIASLKNVRDQNKAALVKIVSEMDGNKELVSYGDKKLTPAEAATTRDQIFDSLQNDERELQAKEQLLASRKKKLENMHAQMWKMKDLRRRLEIELDKLEAELVKLRTEQAESNIKLNDNAYSEIRSELDKVRDDFEIQKKELELTRKYSNRPLPSAGPTQPTQDKLQEIKKYLNKQEPSVVQN